jgi:hypothetical protein
MPRQPTQAAPAGEYVQNTLQYFSGLTSTNTILVYEIEATVLPLDDGVVIETPAGFGPA